MPAAIAFVSAIGLLITAMILPIALALLVWLFQFAMWVLAVVWWAVCCVARGIARLVVSWVKRLSRL